MIEEKDLNAEILLSKIDDILNDKVKYISMKQEASKLCIKNSATTIYNILRKTIDGDK